MRYPLAAALMLALASAHAQQVFDPLAEKQPGGDVAEPGAEAPAKQEAPPEDRTIGFTWWNDVPEMNRRGNERFLDGSYDAAEQWYQDAAPLARQRAEVPFNLGLSQALQKKWSEAEWSFNDAINRSGVDSELKAEAYQNRGIVQYRQALAQINETAKDPKRAPQMKEEAVRQALAAIDSFNEALTRKPGWEEAEFNKAQAQHFLETFSAPPPPPQQQQQQQQGDGEGEGQNQQQQDGQPQDQQGDQEQQEGGSDQPQQGDEQEPQQGENEPQDGEQESQGGGGNARQAQAGRPMTKEEAEQMLQMLGDEERVRIRRRATQRENPEKSW